MFILILSGETVETVMYTDLNDVKEYVSRNYHEFGLYPRIKEVVE